MNLEKFISNYNLDKVKEIEEIKDLQYISLYNSWDSISNKSIITKTNFLYIILQTALISYQLSGKGENWWGEVSNWITKNQNILENNDNIKKWWFFLNNCKNNKRFVSMKLDRLKKFSKYKEKLNNLEKMNNYYENMSKLNQDLANFMDQDTDSKTIVFAIKMFGYGARFIFEKFIPYPFDIYIPIDSRIEKIYISETGNTKYTKKDVLKYFNNLSQKYNIPPLHLDGLLWIEYWYNFM